MKDFFGSLLGTIIGGFLGAVTGTAFGIVITMMFSDELEELKRKTKKSEVVEERNRSNTCEKSEEPEKVPMGFHAA